MARPVSMAVRRNGPLPTTPRQQLRLTSTMWIIPSSLVPRTLAGRNPPETNAFYTQAERLASSVHAAISIIIIIAPVSTICVICPSSYKISSEVQLDARWISTSPRGSLPQTWHTCLRLRARSKGSADAIGGARAHFTDWSWLRQTAQHVRHEENGERRAGNVIADATYGAGNCSRRPLR